MKKTRTIGRVLAGALASAVLLTGALAAPAQAKDTGWPTGSVSRDGTVKLKKDTGWPTGSGSDGTVKLMKDTGWPTG